MKLIVGSQNGPFVVNGGPNPLAGAPALGMGALVFSNAFSLNQGFSVPDQLTIQCPYTIASSPSGVFFLQGSLSSFGGTSPVGPGPADWTTLSNTPVTITAGSYFQFIGAVSLPYQQPAAFRLFNPLPGFLYLRVGYAPISGGASDTFSVYVVGQSISNPS